MVNPIKADCWLCGECSRLFASIYDGDNKTRAEKCCTQKEEKED